MDDDDVASPLVYENPRQPEQRWWITPRPKRYGSVWS
jgi:hypothetical protein